ncbi:MAG: DUF507 family protein [Nitrospirae bacterium]|nr:DUF507 family protein [Candidatus Troglogloeales bacterium]
MENKRLYLIFIKKEGEHPLEGTPEWDLLYQKTLAEMMDKKGLG